MYCAFWLRCSSPVTFNQSSSSNCDFAGANSSPLRRNLNFVIKLRQPRIYLATPSVRSVQEPEASVSYEYTSSVGSSSLQLSQWSLTQRHVLLLNVIACAVAVSATWLFFSAIPTLLAFKRAAESVEKLMDATREELPDTMAAVRLSGMEIGDLTMELSDLGQEITQGVRNSTRAVRIAEERLRQFTNLTPVLVQGTVQEEVDHEGPALARSARNIRENIVKGRSFLQMFFTLTKFSKLAYNYLAQRAKSK